MVYPRSPYTYGLVMVPIILQVSYGQILRENALHSSCSIQTYKHAVGPLILSSVGQGSQD